MMMSPKKLFLVLLAALLVLVGAVLWMSVLVGQGTPSGPSPYSMVAMANGEVYFGKLSWFPSPRLTNVWSLQRVVGADSQIQLAVNQLTRSLGEPVDELFLNSSQIAAWTRLRNSSQLVRVFQNPGLVNVPQAPATSTFQGPSGPPPAQ